MVLLLFYRINKEVLYMTKKQKILGISIGLEKFIKSKKEFIDYFGLLTEEAENYIVPFFANLTLIKADKTRSGKYLIRLSEHCKYNKEQIENIIAEIRNGQYTLP